MLNLLQRSQSVSVKTIGVYWKACWRRNQVRDPGVHKHLSLKRLCVGYSKSFNICTELDAYPLSSIDEMVNKLTKYSVFWG